MLSVDKKTMQFDIAKIRSQFTIKKPNWMIISHASNVCGVVAPIEQLCELSKEFGAINIIDMCQTAGLIDVDLSSDNFDFAVFDGHKTLYSPLGIAGIISDFKIKPSPLIYGGTGIDSANQSLPDSIPERYEVASANIMAIGGLNSALKWIKNTGIHTLYDKEKENHKRLLTILSSHSNIKIIANNTDRVSNAIGVVSCVFDGFSSDNIGKILSDNDVAVRSGLHCAPFAHKFLDTFPSGTVRFSVSYFNSDEDFKLLQTALDYIEENS